MTRMTMISATGLTGLALATVLAGAAQAKGTEAFNALATPPGITLQVMGVGQGYGMGKQAAAVQVRDEIAFADPRGMTLYTYDQDPVGKATCADDCAKTWLPVAAPKGAKPVGDWSLLARADGTRQWAYRGKALYTNIKDVDPGSIWGNSPARQGSRRRNGAGEFVGGGVRGSGVKNAAADLPIPDGWKIAYAYPVAGIAVPTGLAIKEVADAQGLALVDYRSRTLYAFDGDPTKDGKACGTPCVWTPAAAAQLAEPTGDFALVVRDDGIKQWSYKGKGLYTYANDLAPGDANGVGAHKQWAVARIFAYYMPPGVSVQKTVSQGEILANAQGLTLYKRDGHINQSGGGHSLRRGQPPRPAVGRDIGINIKCESECDKWHPFLAPADAQPQGFWNVVARPDGNKQWVYQGYSLWTYDGDKKPGDMNGNDTYEFTFSDEPAPTQLIDVGTSQDGAPALYWAIVQP